MAVFARRWTSCVAFRRGGGVHNRPTRRGAERAHIRCTGIAPAARRKERNGSAAGRTDSDVAKLTPLAQKFRSRRCMRRCDRQ